MLCIFCDFEHFAYQSSHSSLFYSNFLKWKLDWQISEFDLLCTDAWSQFCCLLLVGWLLIVLRSMHSSLFHFVFLVYSSLTFHTILSSIDNQFKAEMKHFSPKGREETKCNLILVIKLLNNYPVIRFIWAIWHFGIVLICNWNAFSFLFFFLKFWVSTLDGFHYFDRGTHSVNFDIIIFVYGWKSQTFCV